jgi:methionine-gamma-lyase
MPEEFYASIRYQNHFVDITKLDVVEAAITPETKVLYCETVSNPLLKLLILLD